MKRTSREFRPGPDGLESRVALSAATSTTPLSAAVASMVAAGRQVVTGTVRGGYFAPEPDNRAADAPLQVLVNGAGTVHRLGRVTMTGTLHFGGFLPPGTPDITGTVTLTNGRGSITIRLTGSGGNGPIPNSRFLLSASIESGTGAYARLRAVGTANALFGDNVVRSIAAPSPLGGSLTLHLNLRPPIR